MGKRIQIQSDFEDLHAADDAEDVELEVDFDQDNPIVKAYIEGKADDDWQEPEKDDDEKPEDSEKEDEDLGPEDEDEEEDEEEESEDEEDEEEDEGDKERYSQRVRNRINRERRLRQEAEDRADGFEARMSRMEKKFEFGKQEEEFSELKSDTNKKLSKLRAKKVAALEEGETEKVVDIDDEILDLRAELKAQEISIKQRRADAKELEDKRQETGDTELVPEAAKRWIRKFPEFNTNTRFYRAVVSADRSVAASGKFEKTSDDYYKAMTDMLSPLFPDIIKRRTKAKARVTKKRRSAVGGTGKAGSSKPAKKRTRRGQIRLTVADQENMRTFGMDPKNPEHVKEYALNKED